MIYEYEGVQYPEYLKAGNAAQWVHPFAEYFCKGYGVDVGCGKWPIQGATPVDMISGGDAMKLPDCDYDFVHSSHSLEHLIDPVGALLHWKDCLKPGGVLFVYLPHPSMRYWQPTRNRKHLHEWQPEQMARIFRDLGFEKVIHSERDLAWGFTVVGFKP